jgi:hypothetical protein
VKLPQFYRTHHYSPDVGEYGFWLVRWALNVISILAISAAIIVIGTLIVKTIYYLWA